MMKKPTRFDAILNFVLTKSPHTVSNLNSGPGLITVTTMQWNSLSPAKSIAKYSTLKLFITNQTDFDVFREALSLTLWETVFLSNCDIDEVWGKWISLFKMLAQAVIPNKRLNRRNHLPWVNGENCKQIRRRRHLWKVAKHKGTPTAWSKYRKLRNLLRYLEPVQNISPEWLPNQGPILSNFMNCVLRKEGMPG